MDSEPVVIGYVDVKLELEVPPNESVGEVMAGEDVTELEILENDLEVKVENKEKAETASSSPAFILPAGDPLEPADWDGVTPRPEMESSCHGGEVCFADPQIEIVHVDVKSFGSNNNGTSTSISEPAAKGEKISRSRKASKGNAKAADHVMGHKVIDSDAHARVISKSSHSQRKRPPSEVNPTPLGEDEEARIERLRAERNAVVRIPRPGRLVCGYCVRFFKSRHAKWTHMTHYHFIMEKIKCPIAGCTYTTYNNGHMKRHRKRRNCPMLLKTTVPQCAECGATLSTMKGLKVHQKKNCRVLKKKKQMEKATDGEVVMADKEDPQAKLEKVIDSVTSGVTSEHESLPGSGGEVVLRSSAAELMKEAASSSNASSSNPLQSQVEAIKSQSNPSHGQELLAQRTVNLSPLVPPNLESHLAQAKVKMSSPTLADPNIEVEVKKVASLLSMSRERNGIISDDIDDIVKADGSFEDVAIPTHSEEGLLNDVEVKVENNEDVRDIGTPLPGPFLMDKVTPCGPLPDSSYHEQSFADPNIEVGPINVVKLEEDPDNLRSAIIMDLDEVSVIDGVNDPSSGAFPEPVGIGDKSWLGKGRKRNAQDDNVEGHVRGHIRKSGSGSYAKASAKIRKEATCNQVKSKSSHRRLPILSVNPTPLVPPNWESRLGEVKRSSAPYKTFPVDATTPEYQSVSKLISPLQVVSISQVVNPILWIQYKNRRRHLLKQKSNGPIHLTSYAPNDSLLFHCTSDKEKLERILSVGLNCWTTYGCRLGNGIYFTDSPKYAAGYDGTISVDENDMSYVTGTLLIFAVLLGDCISLPELPGQKMGCLEYEPKKMGRQMRSPRNKSFDSITSVRRDSVGGRGDNEYVVFNTSNTCPLYMVKYKMRMCEEGTVHDSVGHFDSWRRKMPPLAWRPTPGGTIPMPNPDMSGEWPFYADNVFVEMGTTSETPGFPSPVNGHGNVDLGPAPSTKRQLDLVNIISYIDTIVASNNAVVNPKPVDKRKLNLHATSSSGLHKGYLDNEPNNSINTHSRRDNSVAIFADPKIEIAHVAVKLTGTSSEASTALPKSEANGERISPPKDSTMINAQAAFKPHHYHCIRKKIKCPVAGCTHRTYSESQLRKHQNTRRCPLLLVSWRKAPPCGECGSTFSSVTTLKSHQKSLRCSKLREKKQIVEAIDSVVARGVISRGYEKSRPGKKKKLELNASSSRGIKRGYMGNKPNPNVSSRRDNSLSKGASYNSNLRSTSHDELAKMWKLRPCYVKLKRLSKDEEVGTAEKE